MIANAHCLMGRIAWRCANNYICAEGQIFPEGEANGAGLNQEDLALLYSAVMAAPNYCLFVYRFTPFFNVEEKYILDFIHLKYSINTIKYY